jgi:hypothetical protein
MTPSWDLFIILFFVILTVYGLLLGRGRVFNILINTYVGFVIATELGSMAYGYLSNVTSISHSISMTTFGAKVLIFAFVIFILTMRTELTGANDDANASSLYTATYGFLAAGLMLSCVMTFMGDADRANLFNSSNLSLQIYNYRVLWLVGPIVVLLVSSLVGRFMRR